MFRRIFPTVWLFPLLLLLGPLSSARADIQPPEQFFGFRIGTDGELARYGKIVEYFEHIAADSDRVIFEELGKSTLGAPYVMATISSPENLANLDRLIEINRRLADPRGLTPDDAKALAREGRPMYLVYASIHATEVGNTQALAEVLHRLATESSREIQELLDNIVILMIPSQNPDGQVMVVDHWNDLKGTRYSRRSPDLYHPYVGHDNNRDWFMFTQEETRLVIEKVHKVYKPQLTHDMHQMGSTGARIFVPPFQDPHDPNIHPILIQEQAQIGMAMASALIGEGKTGVSFNAQYDMWTPARQYMVYHGQPRILTEIASVNLTDLFVNPDGAGVPLGPQERLWNFPVPYSLGEWRLRRIVDYGSTALIAGLTHMAKYRVTWLENFYKVHRDWVERTDGPFAFILPAEQRDPFETFELFDTLHFAEVEIHRARSSFTASGQRYDAGSWVIRTAQPYGAFAKTMLEKQVYPDLRLFPSGPPKPPYDITAQTLGLLMGVDVRQVDAPFRADLELLDHIAPRSSGIPSGAGWAYAFGPESNAAFMAVAKLQAADVPIFRSSQSFSSNGAEFAEGTWIVAPTRDARGILEDVSDSTGLAIAGLDSAVDVDGYRLKSQTRIGLWKAANNMPAGWMMWLFEQYGFNFDTVEAMDFDDDLADRYDVIVLPAGTTRNTIINGLDRTQHGEEWRWAFGVGESGWDALAQWVRDGGHLIALGNSTETARQLLDLPIEAVLPPPERRGRTLRSDGPRVPSSEVTRALRDTFQSPAALIETLRSSVVGNNSLFYCPGSLLANEFDPTHPIGYGMPASWPVFFRFDQAYRLRPSFDIQAEVVARYPDTGEMVASGWLLGGDLLRDQANMISFDVGRGSVVTMGSQVAFRTQPRATFKLLFNALYHGPSTKVSAIELAELTTASAP